MCVYILLHSILKYNYQIHSLASLYSFSILIPAATGLIFANLNPALVEVLILKTVQKLELLKLEK
jgi:hypothetical protein